MTCTGTVQDFGELVAVRFLLGLFEAGLFPGAILLISRYVKLLGLILSYATL